jgi:ABC-type multidrug transport system fused ATPase/permease subunit
VFFAIIDTADQIQDTGTVEAPIFRHLHFKDVHLYIPDEEVIKGIDLNVCRKQIPIVGSTQVLEGSTIINLLNRFFMKLMVPFIATRNIENYTLGSLHKQIAVVLQDVFPADTIFNNITLNNPEIQKKMFWLQPRK